MAIAKLDFIFSLLLRKTTTGLFRAIEFSLLAADAIRSVHRLSITVHQLDGSK